MENHFYGYVLVDPETNVPRYVGITKRSLQQRLAGHLRDVYGRPELNPHKTNWFKKLISKGLMPRIELVAEFTNENDLKQFEINYITQHKEEYKLINLTAGGDFVAYQAHSRQSILKKSTTRAVVQYNVLGEKIAEFEITEDIAREYGLRDKACSHITQCCRHTRTNAYGYLWHYKEDTTPLPVLSSLNIAFNKVVQYDKNMNRVAEYNTYKEAALAIGDNSGGSNIMACATGVQKTCKGYGFQLEPTYVYFDQNLFEQKYKESMKMLRASAQGSGKRIEQFDLQGNLINRYNSMLQAANTLGNRNFRQGIADCCKNKIESYKNYIWKFAKADNSPNSGDELNESIQSYQECETTISKESTPQVNGGGNGEHYISEDIV